MDTTLFVIPAFNEEANIPGLLADLESRPELWIDGRVLLVDDGSSDRTAEVAEAYTGPVPVEVLRQPTNMGPGRAFDRGFRRALELGGDDSLVVTLEADTTSDLDVLETMLERARNGADVVLASVHHEGGQLVNVGRHRRFLSQAAAYAIRASAGLDARTVSSFFRVYRSEALRAAYERHGDEFIRERGFACKAEILMKLTGMQSSVDEVPVDLDASRRFGESKLRLLPTVGGYTRLMLRHAADRRRSAA